MKFQIKNKAYQLIERVFEKIKSYSIFQSARNKADRVIHAVHLKDRYIRTKNGDLRMRCKAVPVAVILVMGFAFFPNHLILNDTSSLKLSSSNLDSEADILADVESAEENIAQKGTALSSDDFQKELQETEETLRLKSGDTLAGVLQANGVDGNQAYSIVKALSEYFDPRLVRAGQSIKLKMKPVEGEMAFARMSLASDPIRTIIVEKDNDGEITSEIHEKEIEKQMFAANAVIKNSLYGSAMKEGVPEPVIAQTIKILSWSVDFQRDVRQGDKLEVLYDVFMTDEGEYVRSGEPYYIKLVQANSTMEVYRHEFEDGRVSYFDPKGEGARKGLLTTPVDGARLSSGYGMRRHPVLGYNKLHKGMDFAAPTGTPIYAAADGVIEKASRLGSYGKYIRIRHNNDIKTAYAHLNGYAKGMAPGKRVKQGQVIGYVGSTGRSTGPHLHYEVLLGGKQVNPRSVKVPTSERLASAELKRFEANTARYRKVFKQLLGSMKYASAVQ